MYKRQVYHLASLLSGTSERQPHFAWKLNVEPLLNFLELAKEGLIQKIFWPSSIAVFGKGIPKENVGQDVAVSYTHLDVYKRQPLFFTPTKKQPPPNFPACG